MTSFTDIKPRHERLYASYLAGTALKDDRKTFTKNASTLVDDMVELSGSLKSSEEFEWLRDAIERWQTIFAAVLKIPKWIAIKVPEELEPVVEYPTMKWDDYDLDTWVRNRAHDLAKERAVLKCTSLTPDELLRRFPGTEEEAITDFENATIILACGVVDGRMGIQQLQPSCYRRIASVWLEDVKRLRAYHRWLSETGPPRPASAYWLDACADIEALLTNEHKDWTMAQFDPIRAYFEHLCLTNDSFDAEKAQGLVTDKAYRLSVMKPEGHTEDWELAESYVAGLYPRIVAAVCQRDSTAASEVTDWLTRPESDGDRTHLIVNALEAAVAARFVAGSQPKALAQRA